MKLAFQEAWTASDWKCCSAVDLLDAELVADFGSGAVLMRCSSTGYPNSLYAKAIRLAGQSELGCFNELLGVGTEDEVMTEEFGEGEGIQILLHRLRDEIRHRNPLRGAHKFIVLDSAHNSLRGDVLRGYAVRSVRKQRGELYPRYLQGHGLEPNFEHVLAEGQCWSTSFGSDSLMAPNLTISFGHFNDVSKIGFQMYSGLPSLSASHACESVPLLSPA